MSPQSKSSGCSFKQALADQTPSYDRKRKRKKKRKAKASYYD